jgi:2-polyprenyl-3-methyl-5-hydroxy-6-metoxy-1,4-benzoquinol methylase
MRINSIRSLEKWGFSITRSNLNLNMLNTPGHAAMKESQHECPACGNQGVIIGTSKSEDVLECVECNLCFLKKSVRPNSSNDNNWYQNLRDCPQSLVDAFVKNMEDAYLRQLAVLEKLTTGRFLLEVGCGVGIFLSIAEKRCWNAQGVDASEHAAYFALKHFGISYSASLDVFEKAAFDVVRISHVLEHVPEPKPFLAKLHELMMPEGILAVIVPNREPLCATVVNGLRYIFSDKPKLAGAIYPDMHVLGFSTRSLLQLIAPLGFSVIQLFTISMGNRTYFPMFYDGLLARTPVRSVTLRSFIKYHLPMVIDNLGNPFGKGQWIVGYFRKR